MTDSSTWSGLSPSDRSAGARLLTFGMIWILAIVALVLFLATLPASRYPYDTIAYWMAWRRPELYPAGTSINLANYIYPPPLAQLIWPLTLLPLSTFIFIWSILGIVVYGWLLEPLPLRIRLPAAMCVGTIVLQGNASFLVALALVAGQRYPQAWALPLLTKVTSFLALSWYFPSRRFRPILTALVATGIVIAVSASISPQLWFSWVRTVLDANVNRPGVFVAGYDWYIPLTLRALLAVSIAVLSGAREEPMGLPVAVVVANPDIFPSTLGVLAALPRLLGTHE